jgi:hypothetical protein
MSRLLRRSLQALAALPVVLAAVLPPATQPDDAALTHSEPWLIELGI